ncbi:phenylacetate--CoA ligase family protein [Mesonia sp. K7]|uniref:phenylacetate--CoA ligase family protein n=1 Tax=Mesonia sp. K7 TaxID=2218606 RepID=UPI000DA73D62|nr:AMP-binding protein [Mesonia sp. K7]PZD76837.1 phenylacetate--CoA ligase family protein [Mesonia sp. K7]
MEKSQQLLKEQLLYVQQNSPFYQQWFSKHGFDANDFTLANFKQLPLTSKEQLAEYNQEFVSVPKNEIIDWVTTSGTLGSPVSFALNEHDLQRLALNEELSFQQIGVTKNDVVQIMTTLDRRFMAGLAYFLGLRKLGASVVRAGSGLPQLQWESIERFSPTYLVCVPSFLLKLASYAQKNGIDINKTSVKAAICIGEALRDANNQPTKLAQKINTLWNIELFSTYASTEMSTAFSECPKHQGLHIQNELIFTEILDDNGEEVAQGEIGELVVTPLKIQTMPLVRFATGDMVKKISETYSETGTNLISSVLGRKKQMIKYKGTSLYPQQIDNALNYFELIEDYQIIIKKDEFLNDEIDIKISFLNENYNLKEIEEYMQSQLRVKPNLIFMESSDLHKIIFNENHRKPQRLVDLR